MKLYRSPLWLVLRDVVRRAIGCPVCQCGATAADAARAQLRGWKRFQEDVPTGLADVALFGGRPYWLCGECWKSRQVAAANGKEQAA